MPFYSSEGVELARHPRYKSVCFPIFAQRVIAHDTQKYRPGPIDTTWTKQMIDKFNRWAAPRGLKTRMKERQEGRRR